MIRIKSAVFFSILAAATFVASSRAAHAATLTFTDSVVNAQTDIDDFLPVPEFNSALHGVLTSVTVSLTDDTNISYFLANSTGTDITVDSLRLHPATVNLDFTDPIVGLDASALISINQSIAQEYKNELIPAHSTWTTPLFDAPGSASGTYTDPTVLANFSGNGVISYEATTSTSTTSSTTGATGQGSTGFASATVTVTYNYIATPEPSSLVLLGLGAIALIGVARRRMPTCAA